MTPRWAPESTSPHQVERVSNVIATAAVLLCIVGICAFGVFLLLAWLA